MFWLPWLIVIFVRNPRILLIALVSLSILHLFLHPGSYDKLSKMVGLPISDFMIGFLLIMTVSPMCIMAGRIYKGLTRIKRSRRRGFS